MLQVQDGYLRNRQNIYISNEMHYLVPPGSKNIFRNIRFAAPRGQDQVNKIYLNWISVPATHPLLLTEVFLLDHEGPRGENHQLYFRAQHPDWGVPFQSPPNGANPYWSGQTHYGGVYLNVWDISGIPEMRLTNRQAWAKYGKAVGGAVAPSTDALPGIDGVASGFLRPGLPGGSVGGDGYGVYPGAYSSPLAQPLDEVYTHPLPGALITRHPATEIPVPASLPEPAPG